MNRSVQQAAELQTAVRSATDRAVAGRAHLYGVALHHISDSSDVSTDKTKCRGQLPQQAGYSLGQEELEGVRLERAREVGCKGGMLP